MSVSLPEPTQSDRRIAREVRNSTEKSAERALSIYRVMGIVTGVWLLLLVLEMILKYVVDVSGGHEPVLGTWVAITHGIIYVIYLASVFHLWSTMSWSLSRLVYLAVAGVIPFLSFVLEVVAKKWFRHDIDPLLDAIEARALRRRQIQHLKEEK